MPREGTEENDFVITFSFFLPAEDGRQPSELLQLFTENAQTIASIAVQRWLNPTEVLPRASNEAIEQLPELPAVLSEKRRLKHQLCAVCQEDFLKPEEIGLKDRNQDISSDNPAFNMGMKERMKNRHRQLQLEEDTDNESDPPAANTRSKTRRKRNIGSDLESGKRPRLN